MSMLFNDDDLTLYAADGLELPPGGAEQTVETDGARLWFASYGEGPAVILLHGGMGHSGNFGKQVDAIAAAGYRVVVVDSRGHGRSTRDSRPFSYALLASDLEAVMDAAGIDRASIVGWSDGADTGLLFAMKHPERVTGLFFFACNVDPSGTRDLEFTDLLGRCIGRHAADYERLSPVGDFDQLGDDLGEMQKTQPNLSQQQLATVKVPVLSVLGEHDEFIKRSHAQYLARSIPGARFELLEGVSHFAPIQRPQQFTDSVLRFLSTARASQGDGGE
jgi:pimeloyl-ACP methyl ester carboxylesterase